MFIVLGLLLASIVAGLLLRRLPIFKHIDTTTSYTVYALLFVFGITIGADPHFADNILHYGFAALLLAVAGVVGSVAAAYVAHKIFKKGGTDEK